MLVSLYYAVLMMGINNLGPANFEEYLFSTVTLIITSIVNAQIFGEVAVLISTMLKKKTKYQNKLD
jgi:flagellar biosynthesis regulator FlbT